MSSNLKNLIINMRAAHNELAKGVTYNDDYSIDSISLSRGELPYQTMMVKYLKQAELEFLNSHKKQVIEVAAHLIASELAECDIKVER